MTKALTLRPIRFPGSRIDSLFAHYTKLSKMLAHLGFLCKTDGKGHLTPPPLDNIIGMRVVLRHMPESMAILDRIVEASALDAASPQDPHQSCGVGFRLLSSSSVDDILVFVFTLLRATCSWMVLTSKQQRAMAAFPNSSKSFCTESVRRATQAECSGKQWRKLFANAHCTL